MQKSQHLVAAFMASLIQGCLGFLLVWALPGSATLKAQDATLLHVNSVHIEGAEHSDPAWILDYSGLHCPCSLSQQQLEKIRLKLLTTQVFQDVDLKLLPRSSEEEVSNELELKLLEKWTVIPVVRAAFGGGTPLFVAGVYDTHSFGRLWTLGAETRTYGSAPTGGVIWVRAPRWLEGHHYLNLELWRDNRVRSVYDREDKEQARIYGSATAVLAEILRPLNRDASSRWQVGLRVQIRQQDTLDWQEQLGPEDSIPDLNLKAVDQKRLLARLVYDDMAVLQQNLQGLRLLLSAGPSWSQNDQRRNLEQELFWYGLWEPDWNLSFHEWLGLSDDQSYQSLYFLGGFDSVRGLPDGLLYGNKAVYTNLELRKVFYRSTYASWQAATYLDYGAAAFSTRQWSEHDRKTWGVGVRVAIPQVNRLVFRVDYAWSVDRPKTSSISAGMNQFIDPYRPL